MLTRTWGLAGQGCVLQLWVLPNSRVQLLLRQKLPNVPAGRGHAHLVEALTPTPLDPRHLSGKIMHSPLHEHWTLSRLALTSSVPGEARLQV